MDKLSFLIPIRKNALGVGVASLIVQPKLFSLIKIIKQKFKKTFVLAVLNV